MSKNKYDIGLTNFKYKIRLDKWNLIKGYIIRMTLAMLEAINQEFHQLEKVKFIEPSTPCLHHQQFVY